MQSMSRVEGALQREVTFLFELRLAQLYERVSPKSIVVLSTGSWKSNHFGAQGAFKG